MHLAAQGSDELSPSEGATPKRPEDVVEPMPTAAASAEPPQIAALSEGKNAGFALAHQPEPHYFLSRELTERPQVLQDVSSDLGLIFSGVPAQNAVLRLFINEQGNIDRVVVEQSYLPEDAARALTDGFLKMKFRPGKIGETTVKSQMKIEVRLDSVLPIH